MTRCALCDKNLHRGAGFRMSGQLTNDRGLHKTAVLCRTCYGKNTFITKVFLCTICRHAYVIDIEDSQWGKFEALSSIPCPECSLSKKYPKGLCTICGDTTNFSPFNGWLGPDGSVYCDPCSESLTRCCAEYCIHIIHPDHPDVSAHQDNLFHCNTCTFLTLPDDFPLRHHLAWDFDPECGCKTCVELSELDPDQYPLAPTSHEKGRGQCSKCSQTVNKFSFRNEHNENFCHTCVRTCRLNSCPDCKIETYFPLHPNVRGHFACSHCHEAAGRWFCDIRCKTWFSKAAKDCNCDGVYEYNFTYPDPPFLSTRKVDKTKTPFLGVELEVECGTADCTRKQGAKLLKTLVDWAYPVRDGSLRGSRGNGTGGDFGLEIVTFPFTFDWFKEHWSAFEHLLDSFVAAGFRSWESPRCGMHIHISRAPMTEGHQAKFIRLIYGSTNLALTVGQRGYRSQGVSHFASFTNEDRRLLLNKIRRNENPGVGNHRVALNTMNPHTMEGRWFRGTLNPLSFRKNVEFMHAAWEFTRSYGFQTANETNFIEWLRSGTHDYGILLEYLEQNYLGTQTKGKR